MLSLHGSTIKFLCGFNTIVTKTLDNKNTDQGKKVQKYNWNYKKTKNRQNNPQEDKNKLVGLS